SSADIMLAIERKEADGRAGSLTSITPFIDRKLVRPIMRARAVEPGIEKLPGTPDATANIMRKAFAETIADKDLVAEAKKAKMDLNYLGADDAQKMLKEMLEQPKDVVEEFSKYIKFGE